MNGKEKFIKTIQLVILIAIIETFTQVSLKHGSTTGILGNGDNVEIYLIYGIIGYCIIAYILWNNFSFDGMGQVNLLWNCITTVTAFIAGYFLFKETVNKYTGYSIVFALMAIYFSYLSDIENEA